MPNPKMKKNDWMSVFRLWQKLHDDGINREGSWHYSSLVSRTLLAHPFQQQRCNSVQSRNVVHGDLQRESSRFA